MLLHRRMCRQFALLLQNFLWQLYSPQLIEDIGSDTEKYSKIWENCGISRSYGQNLCKKYALKIV